MFKANREKIINDIKDNSLLIIFAGDAPYRSADQKYKFTPNRNFYYLTGIDKPNIILTILKTNKEITETIYVERENEVMAKWIGTALTKNEACEISTIQSSKYLDELDSTISSYMDRMGIKNIYFDLERQSINIPSTPSQDMANRIREKYPYIKIKNIHKENK